MIRVRFHKQPRGRWDAPCRTLQTSTFPLDNGSTRTIISSRNTKTDFKLWSPLYVTGSLLVTETCLRQPLERNILLTESGRAYARNLMELVYRAEDKALKETMEQYSDTFIEAIEFYGAALKTAFQEEQDGRGEAPSAETPQPEHLE